jgi:hypothetical protein
MKDLLSFLTILAVLGSVQKASHSAAAQPHTLYLHFFEANPPRCILTTRVYLAQDFDVRVDVDGGELSGRIEARAGKYFAKVSGIFAGSTEFCNEELLLEKPFVPSGQTVFSYGVITYLVLSTNSDSTPFLVNILKPAK